MSLLADQCFHKMMAIAVYVWGLRLYDMTVGKLDLQDVIWGEIHVLGLSL